MPPRPDGRRSWPLARPARPGDTPQARAAAWTALVGSVLLVGWVAGPAPALAWGALATLTGLSAAKAWRRARSGPAPMLTLQEGYLELPEGGVVRHIPIGPGAPTQVGIDEARHVAWLALPRFAETWVLVGDVARTPVSLAWPAGPVPRGHEVALDAADLATLARALQAD
jgi:hypothetical protein